MKRWTAEEVWAEMWPDDPYESASEGDKRLVAAHAESLNLYYETRT